MKKYLAISICLFTMSLLPSCKNGKQVKKGVEIVKKLSGKLIKSSEKSKFMAEYSDDVIRQLEFVKIKCPECNGTGYDAWGYVCEECDGDGKILKIQAK